MDSFKAEFSTTNDSVKIREMISSAKKPTKHMSIRFCNIQKPNQHKRQSRPFRTHSHRYRHQCHRHQTEEDWCPVAPLHYYHSTSETKKYRVLVFNYFVHDYYNHFRWCRGRGLEYVGAREITVVVVVVVVAKVLVEVIVAAGTMKHHCPSCVIRINWPEPYNLHWDYWHSSVALFYVEIIWLAPFHQHLDYWQI